MRLYTGYFKHCFYKNPCRAAWFLASVLLLLLRAQTPLLAQTDSLFQLREVEVRSLRAEKNGYTTWSADSIPTSNITSLSERLFWENAAEIRPNAPGTLATLSIRGAGAKRSPVFWNGLPLQSPMNGVIDLTLIPVWPGDLLDLRYGGQSAAQSSGSLGGSVALRSQPFQQKNGFFGHATLATGSWDRKETAASMGYSQAKWASCARTAWQQASNDFPYRNFTQIGKPRVRQANNFGEKWDIEQYNQLIINKKNLLKSGIWFQRAFREIPPTMTQAPQETWQRDRNTRSFVTWENRPAAKTTVQTRMAWLDEGIFFSLQGKTDSSRARTLLFSSDFTAEPARQFLLKTGVNAQRQWANADGYSDSTRWYTQNRLAFYATAARSFKSGNLSLLLRQEWSESQGAAFTWSLGGQFRVGIGLLQFHLARNFNLPTFNDRFWLDYGRKDLKPEKGYSSDLGWKYTKSVFSAEVSVFQLLMDDWIDWQPGDDGIFRPFNLKKVWSRGGSLSGSWHWQKGSWKCDFSGRYQFLTATNVSIYAGEQAVLGKQLVYTPRHSAGGNIRVAYRRLSAAYLQQFTGPRFITSDNQQTLPGFQSGNLMCQYAFSKKTAHYTLGFRLENIWNTPYQVLQYRPMPGRAWRIEAGLAF
jgi:iron complex outermembrane receptor protein